MNTHDFRKQYWGHALHPNPIKGKTLTGSCHTQKNLNVGDEMIWATNFGHVIAKVTKVEWCRDPYDMYFFTAKVKRRIVTVEVTDEQRKAMGRKYEFAND